MQIILPDTDDFRAIAARVIWFEPPEIAMRDPVRFLAYAMRYADWRDMLKIREIISMEQFGFVLRHAPPGIIDPRSFAYWAVLTNQRDLSPNVRRFS